MELRRSARFAALLALAAAAAFGASRLPAPEGSAAARLGVETLSLELLLAGSALALASLSRRPLRLRLGLAPGRLSPRLLALVVVGAIATSHALDGVLDLSGLRDRSSLATFELALAGARGHALALALVGVGLAPGIAEELFCRGLLQRGLERRMPPAAAILLAAALFGVLHVDPVHAVFAAVLGVYFGLAAHLAGSIRAAIACHAINNLLVVWVSAFWPEARLSHPITTAMGFAVAAASLLAVDHGLSPRAPRARTALPG